MRKFVVMTLISILILPVSGADATETLVLSSYDYVSTAEVWAVEFAPDGETLYFAENGGIGIRRIATSDFLANSAPVATNVDGYSDFRLIQPKWQVTDLEGATAPGKDGHFWFYGTGGNNSSSASPADSLNRTVSGVVWAVDRTTNNVVGMNTKRSDGNWQVEQMFDLTITPDNRYVYARGYLNKNNVWSAELFKYATATNTQVGKGIPDLPFTRATPVSDNANVYYATNLGLLRSVIDADITSNNGDSSPSAMAINWTNTPFDFSDLRSLARINGELYLGSMSNDVIGVVDPVTLTGTTYKISNAGPNKVHYGLKMGVDGCIYSVRANSDYDNYSVSKINLSAQKEVSSITMANFSPLRDGSMSMNNAGTVLVVSPRSTSQKSLKYISISGSECGGVSLYSGAREAAQKAAEQQRAEAAQKAAAQKAAEQQRAEAAQKAAELKRIEEVKQAKESVIKKVVSGGSITAKDLADAEMGTPSTAATFEINKTLASLPIESRADLEQVNKVVKKYLAYDNLTSIQVSAVSPKQLVEVGILTELTPGKSLIIHAIKKADPLTRDSFEKVIEIIQKQVTIYETRKAKLTKRLSRNK